MSQTRRMSAIESIANILIGCGISFLAQIIFFPLIGLAVSISDNILLCLIFTAISLIRSYAIRRVFNRL